MAKKNPFEDFSIVMERDEDLRAMRFRLYDRKRRNSIGTILTDELFCEGEPVKVELAPLYSLLRCKPRYHFNRKGVLAKNAKKHSRNRNRNR